MQITKATTEDSRDIWMWRNDAQSRAMSKTTEAIDWDTHSTWYNQSLVNPRRFLFIGHSAEGDKIGMCRFDVDRDERSAEVSINLNPTMRGKRLSGEILGASISTFWSTRPLSLTAAVKKANIASIKCFASCGFVLEREDNDYYYYIRIP